MDIQDIIEKVQQAAKDGRDVLISGPVDNSADADLAIATLYGALVGGPFRAPHHTVSERGAKGEAELAEGGTLFLMDLPEFRIKAIIEAATTNGHTVASANICPCGQHPTDQCVCSEDQITRFQVRAASLAKLALDNPVRIAFNRRLTVQECEKIYNTRNQTGNWPPATPTYRHQNV